MLRLLNEIVHACQLLGPLSMDPWLEHLVSRCRLIGHTRLNNDLLSFSVDEIVGILRPLRLHEGSIDFLHVH